MKNILISGGTIVNEGRRFVGYVLVHQGIIAEIGEGWHPVFDAGRGSRPGDFRGERIDATGLIVMPGVIDAHVHFREPGLEAKGDMESESAAAVAGGVTSVLEMPNTVPPTVSRDALARKMELAEGRMHTNYAFFLGATTDNLQEIKRFQAEGGRLVKVFLGSSTGGMLVDDDRALTALFAEFGGVIAAHCEDEAMIRAETNSLHARFPDGPGGGRGAGFGGGSGSDSGDGGAAAAKNAATAALHPLIRSAEACYVATARAVELADRYGTDFHVCHLSTAREIALFDSRPLARIAPTALSKGGWVGSDGLAAEPGHGGIRSGQESFDGEPGGGHRSHGSGDRPRDPGQEYGGQAHPFGSENSRQGGREHSTRPLPERQKRITAEVCVPHLWFDEQDYARLGNMIKCNPAIKTAADRMALLNTLTTNKIDLVATDHAPHTAAEKSRGYWDAPSGIPSVQHSLVVMMELVLRGRAADPTEGPERFSRGVPGGLRGEPWESSGGGLTLGEHGGLTLEGLVERMCHAPAVRFGLVGRGFLRVGYVADIVIVDPTIDGEDWVVGPANILSKCGWSPWEGVRFGARVAVTIVGGRVAWNGSELAGPSGRPLEFF